MYHNQTNMYDVEPHIAEIYDVQESIKDDIDFIRNLAGERRCLNILEPFCGTGRISIPLAQDGHNITGLDQARGMLDYAREKIERLPEDVQDRIVLHHMDVVESDWPAGFDMVILGANCLYELAISGEQEKCIVNAANSLKPGGYVYVDNDHMEGDLDSSWIASGVTGAFPTGKCSDGTEITSQWEVIWYDIPERLCRFRRITEVKYTDGNVLLGEVIQQKHPVSMPEVKTWLESSGFIIEKLYGDWAGNSYSDNSPRAIFWARKEP